MDTEFIGILKAEITLSLRESEIWPMTNSARATCVHPRMVEF